MPFTSRHQLVFFDFPTKSRNSLDNPTIKSQSPHQEVSSGNRSCFDPYNLIMYDHIRHHMFRDCEFTWGPQQNHLREQRRMIETKTFCCTAGRRLTGRGCEVEIGFYCGPVHLRSKKVHLQLMTVSSENCRQNT